MKNNLTLFTFLLGWIMTAATSSVSAQNIGINADGSTPDTTAILDIKSPATGQKGILFPRINLVTGISTSATHLFGVNTNTAFGAGSRFNSGLGLYRFDGTRWNRLLESTDSTMFWGTRGNNISSGDFLGTTNQGLLSIRTDNIERMRIGYQNPPSVINDITILNTRAVEFPAGSISFPSLRFTSSANQAGIFGDGVNGIGITSNAGGGGAKIFLSLTGVRIGTQGTFQIPQSGTQLHVEGNIFTQSKVVYSGSSSSTLSSPVGTAAQPLTGNVNRYWSGNFGGDGTSVVAFNGGIGLERFVVNRTANNYRLIVSSTGIGGFTRDFSWSAYSVPGLLSASGVIGVPNATTYIDIPFDMTGANSTHVIYLTRRVVSGGNDTSPTYRITVTLNGDTDYIRVLFEVYSTE